MKTILFVCGHNAGRSQMAEAYFNHINTNPKLLHVLQEPIHQKKLILTLLLFS